MNIPNFKIGIFSLIIQFTEKAQLPLYKGSTLRGGFGVAFKKTVCADWNKTCDNCFLSGKCVYSAVFESPVDKNNILFKGMNFAPHPFIIEPPISKKENFEPGDKLEFKIILFGKYIDNFVYFVHSFMKLGKIGLGKGRADFKIISVKDFISNRELFLNNNSLSADFSFLSASDILVPQKNTTNISDFDNNTINQLTLNFETPARIKYKGHFIDNLPFNIFWKNVLRRIRIICSLYGDEILENDWQELSKLSDKINIKENSLIWKDWQRYSHRQKSKMMFGGITGSVTYSGPLNLFVPYINLCQFLHLGKNTSFGLGKYVLEI